jgi:hypothetical protein
MERSRSVDASGWRNLGEMTSTQLNGMQLMPQEISQGLPAEESDWLAERVR